MFKSIRFMFPLTLCPLPKIPGRHSIHFFKGLDKAVDAAVTCHGSYLFYAAAGVCEELSCYLHALTAEIFIHAVAKKLTKAIFKLELVHSYFLGDLPDDEMVADVLPDHITGGLDAIHFVIVIVAGGLLLDGLV